MQIGGIVGSRAFRAVAMISGGSLAGQLISFLLTPVLSRVVSPTEFGIFVLVASVAQVVGNIAPLRYDFAIQLPRDSETTATVMRLGFISSGGMAALATLVVAFWGDSVARRLGSPDLMPALFAAPLIGGAMGAYAVLNQMAIRRQRYAASASRSFIQSGSTAVTQLVLCLKGAGAGGLLAGLAMGYVAAVFSLLRSIGPTPTDSSRILSVGKLKRTATTYRRFPLLLTPAGLINILALQLPVLLIGSWYGSHAAGNLGMANRVLAVPVSMVGAAVGQVYLSRLAQARREGSAGSTQLFRRATRSLLPLGLLGAAMFVAAGPILFEFALGDRWRTSGSYAQAMAPAAAAQLIAVPISQTLIVLQRHGTQFLWDVCRLAATGSAIYFARAAGWDAIHAMWLFSAVSCAAYLCLWAVSWRALRHDPAAPPMGHPSR